MLCSEQVKIAQHEVWKPGACFKKTPANLLDMNQKEMNIKDIISARFKDLFFSTI